MATAASLVQDRPSAQHSHTDGRDSDGPFIGQGAAQVIEDSATLAACLLAAGPGEPSEALRRYEALRRLRVTRLQEIAALGAAIAAIIRGARQRVGEEGGVAGRGVR